MLSKSKMKTILILAFVSFFVFIANNSVYAANAGYQKCTEGSACSIGEYLYDDSYSPVTDATCTLTSRYPDGTLFLNAQAMTAAPQNDGWYSYTFNTAEMTIGTYRSQISCTTNGDTLKLDKTFSIEEKVVNQVWDATASAHTNSGSFGEKLQNSVPSTTDIWSYPSRTLSSFGTLVSDIWNYSARSLTTFGTLVADVWGSATRTLTGANLADGGQLATKSDVDSATSSATTSIKGAGNKDLTQINTGIVTAQSSLDSLTTTVNSMNTKVDTINTNTSSILAKWGSYSAGDLISYVDTLETSLGSNSDACSGNTIFGSIKCVRDKWGTQTADSLFTAANNAATYSAALRNELNYNGKSSTAYDDLQSIKAYAQTLNTNIGSSGDNSSALTVFGKIQATRDDISSSTTSIKGPNNKSLSDVSTEVAGVSTTVNTISTNVDSINTTVDGIDTKADTILAKWGSYTMSDLMTAVNALDNSSLGDAADGCLDSTIFGQVNCIKGKWGSRTADDIYNSAITTQTNLDSLRNELNYNGKSSTAYADMQSIITEIASMQTKIGSSADTSSATTLYGRLKLNKETIENLDTSGAGLSDLLAKWDSYTASDIIDEINAISTDVSGSNSISGVSEILTLSQANASDLQTLKNSVLSLQALTQANKTLLENGTKSPIVQTWMEEGSIIFKTLITNPTGVAQTIPVKFYLPKEATEKDVIKKDDDLSIEYDAAEDAYYASGQVVLAPNATKIYAVEVEDIWKISDEEISSLKIQAKEIYEPLKGTSYFGQGATLYADIIASLDSAARLQKEANTPEQRIKAYREAKIQVDKAKSEINDLKTLGTSASSAGTLFGFVGGVQTLAVWGMVVILLAGFVFLALYMRLIVVGHKNAGKKSNFYGSYFEPITKNIAKLDSLIGKKLLVFMFLLIIVLVSSLFIFKFAFKSSTHEKPKLEVNNYQKNDNAVYEKKDDEHEGDEINLSDEKSVLGVNTKKNLIEIIATPSAVNLREGPSLNAKIIKKISQTADANKINQKGDWVQVIVDIDGEVKGWVNSQFIINK
ncbi:hypothetical protein E6Q11_03365 [Candidatus Dojkabacteria bacterium]|uniref:SH3b domain-containing protein n=1 Tax=Candidatus Dojkabacteria bacterium TaxID=2099670 RepID=A0A5C7J805_9BACT|nr:MAG: hypothetical protein E6Q11_03365 [Candidatus Dojkabacteria bacterium]